MWPLGISPISPPTATAEVDGRSPAKCDPWGVNLGFGGTNGLDAATAGVVVGVLCFSPSNDLNAGDAPMESSALVFGLNGDAVALSAPNAGAAPNGDGDAGGAPNALVDPSCVDATGAGAPKLKPPPDACVSCPAGLTENGDAAPPVWGAPPNGEFVGALCAFEDPNGDATAVPPDPNGFAPAGADVVVPNGVGVVALAPKGELDPAPNGDADVEPNAPLV